MITPLTEVIFIEKAVVKTLDAFDWKVLTHGGYIAHDVKYQTARAVINKCLMLVTVQRQLECGPTHPPAMDKRLRTYCFKSLENKKKKQGSSLNHAMDSIVWAVEKAKGCENDTTDSDEECILEDEEGILTEKEKKAIRSLSLLNPPMERTTAADGDEEGSMEDTMEEDDTVNDLLAVSRESLERWQPDSLRYRQVKHIICEKERKLSQQRNFAKRRQENLP